MTLTNSDSATSAVAPNAPAYRVRGLTRTYRRNGRQIVGLDGVDLDIADGSFVTVQGPTGGGKSTLLQMLGALDRPTAGEIWCGETNLATASTAELTRVRAHDMGFVFQAFNLIPTLTAYENVNVALEPLHLGAAERESRVQHALAVVGLDGRADHRPSELSGGQQQRVAVARAMVKRPRVLLADEPTGNLDEQMRDDILDVLGGLHADGLTLIVVTHDSAVARRATRRLRLADGRIEDITRR